MKSLLRGLLAASVGVMAIACATDYAAAPASEIATDSGATDGEPLNMDATVVDQDAGDAGDAGVDAGPTNLLRNPGFESGTCDGWVGVAAKLTTVAGREGGAACRVCGIGSADGFGIGQTVPSASGGTTGFLASVWTRGTADGGSAPTLSLELTSSSTPPTYVALQVRNDRWTLSVSELAAETDSPVTLSIMSRHLGDPCFLVDDASLVVRAQ